MNQIRTARMVEAAMLHEMSGLDIDDVYTLMDVQLRERPTPKDLFQRWEKQTWSAYDIDFSVDTEDWLALPEFMREQLMWGLALFYLGEGAVTDTLSPLVLAAPSAEDRQFLATQLADEARHSVFFERFFQEVLGIKGIDDVQHIPGVEPHLRRGERSFGRLLFTHLEQVTDAVRLDTRDYGKWVDGITLYHMVVEGMLALYGQRGLLRAARLFNVLPAFRAGFTAVTRDESRHVNYGVYALRCAVGFGLHDRIVETCSNYLEDACAVLTRFHHKIPSQLPSQSSQDGSDSRPPGFTELWSLPIRQLRRRLSAAGVSRNSLVGLERQWWREVDRNLDDYEKTFGEAHPARSEDAWLSRHYTLQTHNDDRGWTSSH